MKDVFVKHNNGSVIECPVKETRLGKSDYLEVTIPDSAGQLGDVLLVKVEEGKSLETLIQMKTCPNAGYFSLTSDVT